MFEFDFRCNFFNLIAELIFLVEHSRNISRESLKKKMSKDTKIDWIFYEYKKVDFLSVFSNDEKITDQHNIRSSKNNKNIIDDQQNTLYT